MADPTGNRRLWSIACESINPQHGLDMQQVWAEIYELFLQGESWHLTLDELAALNKQNKKFEVGDPIDEKIIVRYLWDLGDIDKNGVWKTATQVLEECGIERPSRTDQNRAANTIKRLNGGKARRTGEGRYLLMPPLKTIPLNQTPGWQY